MADSPISQEAAQKRDYWDDPNAAAGHEDDAVAATSPDTPRDHQATEPDMFGTTRRTGEAPAAVPAAEGQPGAATIADVPAARTPVGEAPAGEAQADAAPAGGAPASDVPAPAAEAAGRPGGTPRLPRPARPTVSCGPARRPPRSVISAISPTGTWSRTRSSSPRNGRRFSSGSSTIRMAP